MEHPDHTGESSNPRAPWNQVEVDDHVLICSECGDESPCWDDEIGARCSNWFVGSRPASDEDPHAERCTGTYQLKEE